MMGYTPCHLDVAKNAGYTNVYLNETTTGYGYIFANKGLSTVPYILIDDFGATIGVGSGDYLRVADSGAGILLTVNHATPDIEFNVLANKNLYLKPSGTGKIKFGTHTATGDAVSDGSIEIIDAGGTPRKLMTKA